VIAVAKWGPSTAFEQSAQFGSTAELRFLLELGSSLCVDCRTLYDAVR